MQICCFHPMHTCNVYNQRTKSIAGTVIRTEGSRKMCGGLTGGDHVQERFRRCRKRSSGVDTRSVRRG